MRYLGLILDGRWSFGQHFIQLSPKLINSAAALGRLLPNVGGPETPCRRLYAGVVRSMALYGAPIWVDSFTARNKALLRRSQRVIAVRVMRGYRTVPWTVATLLASDPPWELQAEVLAEVYRFRVEARSSGDCPGLVEVKLTQVLTGHGCFSRYLHRIARREMTPSCHECGAPSDTARNTLIECSACGPQRHSLAAIIGRDLSLLSVINAMIGSERCWKEMVLNCENVMTHKEAAERERENSAAARFAEEDRGEGVFVMDTFSSRHKSRRG
ncbi:uncharacterized protein LOC113403570 [Vanessa tameamea]|uniref:Uncharacterized protein LOC113403570 n=1 Tax=Vanessa tameamea TaxID=334116 RepID=A0ABM4AQ68_VANTA